LIIIYARIKAREKIRRKSDSQEQTIKELKASIRRLETALKAKRENLEL